MKTIRTFLAVPLPDDLAAAATRWIHEVRTPGDSIKWVPTDNLHLTLKFLGDVENVETPRVCSTLDAICERFEPFELDVRGASGLPALDRARVLTIAIDDPSGSLMAMVNRIEERFADLGYKREPRDYRPHLTLGRVRSGVRKASDEVIERWSRFADQELGEMVVDHVQVVGSFLEKRGPTYNVLGTIDL